MSLQTNINPRSMMIYSVFVRNHTPEGTFHALEADLNRIADLGTDILWLLPIHPIGQVARKGTLGSPYAIQNYRTINPEYGTFADFERLVDKIHSLGMKCMIDVVYNHTSPDSWLATHHPEWFHHNDDNHPISRTPQWSDTVDLNYGKPELWHYQIETLVQWASLVDGFRCDVASLVPLAFWMEARKAVEAVHPGFLWLAESIHPGFILQKRAQGHIALSDSEIFQAFDISYDYDVRDAFDRYIAGSWPLDRYIEQLVWQQATYPDNYIKLRFLENHDNRRAADLIPNPSALTNWTAFMYMLQGTALIYAGQEAANPHCPSLFDKDLISWDTGVSLQELLIQLHRIKKMDILARGHCHLEAQAPAVVALRYSHGNERLYGIFSLDGAPYQANLDLPDGQYSNLLDGTHVEIVGGKVSCNGTPTIWITKTAELSSVQQA